MKNINNNQNLNFTQVKDILAQQAITIAAKEQLSSVQPSSNLHKVEQLLNETEEAVKILKLRQHIPFASSEDIEHLITKAEKGLILTPDDLEKVAEFLRVNRLLQRFLARHEQLAPLLNAYVQDMTLLPDIEDAIYTTIEHGQVRDEADRELAKMCRDLKKSVTELKTALNHFLTSKPNQKMIRDAMIVEKEGYATIPIKANYKNQLSGTIVAVSNGGQTVYFQPAKVVRLNQQITNLKAQIRNLELAILGALTAKIYDVKDDIKRNIELITLLDMIFARGKFAQKYNCIRPKINRENSLVLRAVRHPLIINPVPLTLELTQENSVLMITGPNAGGKTVALKTTGLMILMTELGLFLPSDKPCDIPLMDDVFTLIGDHQDLDNSLSTFSAEMKDIAMITKYAQFHSLVLLDELGTGTDPNEGSALAIGILQELYLRGCLIMATT
ncbi:MAG: DNA mismatch repair protein MutS, partial [Lactobacillus crispatus]|nr:DNA mismatch repair protein MutS [Lactobacillus crispatus]